MSAVTAGSYYSLRNYFLRPDSSILRIVELNLTCVVQTPGICCSRHWWDGERWRPTVGLHQFALERHRRGGCRLSVWLTGCWRGLGLWDGSQRGLEGGDSVELHSRQTPDEAWGVVALDDDWVYVSCFCTETKLERITCYCLMRTVNSCGIMSINLIDAERGREDGGREQKETRHWPQQLWQRKHQHWLPETHNTLPHTLTNWAQTLVGTNFADAQTQ